MNKRTHASLVHRSLAVSVLLAVVAFAVAGAMYGDVVSGEGETEPPAEARAVAEYLAAAAELRQGLLVHVNCGDGRLTAALGQAGNFLVHGLSPDPEQISLARQHIQGQKLHDRVSVDRQSGAHLLYVDNLANAVIVDDLAAALGRGLTIKEVVRVLCPGGIALLGQRADAPAPRLTIDRLKAILAEAGFKEPEVLDGKGLWARLRKPWPADPDPHTPPSRVQWLADPIWSRGHFSTLNWRSAGGRVFYFFDEAPTQVEGPAQVTLIARDAFNGLLLWKRSMPGDWQYPALQRAVGRMLATNDTLYVVLEENGPLVALDAASGDLVWRFRAAPADRRIVVDGRLESAWPVYGSVLVQNDTVFFTAGRDARLDGGMTLFALAPRTGEVRWQKRLEGDLVNDVLVSDGRSVCLPTLRFDPATGEAAEVDPWRPTQLRAGRGGLLDGALAIREGSWSSPVGGGRLLILDGRHDPRMTNDAAWSSPKADGQVQVFNAQRAYALSTDVSGDRAVKQGAAAWTLRAREGRKGHLAWSITVPIRPRAMLLARNVLLLAGTPDVLDPENPWAAIRGERGAVMWTISTADGRKLAETTFDVPPVWDGLAAAGERLYATLTDGTVLCLGEARPE